MTDNVAVLGGVTLNIDPGTAVYFEGGNSLEVYGTMVAVGTDQDEILFTSAAGTPAPGDWQSIHFAAGASGNSIIDNCVIEYADTGVRIDNADQGIVVSNSTIRNCEIEGIRVDYSSADIIGNTIANPGLRGIFLNYAEASLVENNDISGFSNGNYQETYAIQVSYCTDGETVVRHNSLHDGGQWPEYGQAIRNQYSNATYTYNEVYNVDKGGKIFGSPYAEFSYNWVHNNRIGLQIVNGNPVFNRNDGPHFGGRNVIANNTEKGIAILSSAHPDLGFVHMGLMWLAGYNDIYGNNGSGAEIKTTSSTTTYAHGNWWGVANPSQSVVYYGSGTVNYSNALSDPVDPFNPIVGGDPPGALKALVTPEGQLLAEARGRADRGDLSGAIADYESLVEQYSYSPEAYVALGEYVRVLFKADQFPNKAAYLKVMSNSPNHPLRRKARLFWMDAALENGEYPEVVKYCEKQIKRHRGTPIEEDMYLQMGIIYLDFADDPAAALEQYELLESKFPNSEMLSMLATMINNYLGEQLLVAKPGQGAGKTQAVEILPEIYVLHNAYPNPFNPSTAIRYDLPQASRVQLTIYDIMGREVYTNAAMEVAGYHSITWQGRSRAGRALPSGIYLYRLLAIPTDGGQPYIATRKMLLLK